MRAGRWRLLCEIQQVCLLTLDLCNLSHPPSTNRAMADMLLFDAGPPCCRAGACQHVSAPAQLPSICLLQKTTCLTCC